jgi:hypothetical protein
MKVLFVADWAVDAHTLVAEASRRAAAADTELGLVVPAWLHGLDWAGDPHASVPCACRQVETIGELAAGAGLWLTVATVGDPDPATAIYDTLETWPADEIVLFAPTHRLVLRPFDLRHRAQRMTGLPVHQVAMTHGRRTHCAAEVAAAA